MNRPLDIIVVEDHDLLRRETVLFLQRPSWRVRDADCGEALDALVRVQTPHIVVLDLNLPHEDGLSIARRLRAALPQIGIVMLTARTRPSDRAAGYETGVDVYLTKPTNVIELESVILNLGRRLIPPALAELVLNMTACTVGTPNGANLGLTRKEAQLLHGLATAPERQLAADHLLQRISQDNTLSAQRENLTVLVSRLRSKLDDAMPHKNIIKSVRSYGYKLTVRMLVE